MKLEVFTKKIKSDKKNEKKKKITFGISLLYFTNIVFYSMNKKRILLDKLCIKTQAFPNLICVRILCGIRENAGQLRLHDI